MRESCKISAMRPTTALLRAAGTAGVASAFCNSVEARGPPRKRRNSETASRGPTGEPPAVTTSASALAYLVATAVSVISDRGQNRAPRHPAYPATCGADLCSPARRQLAQ